MTHRATNKKNADRGIPCQRGAWSPAIGQAAALRQDVGKAAPPQPDADTKGALRTHSCPPPGGRRTQRPRRPKVAACLELAGGELTVGRGGRSGRRRSGLGGGKSLSPLLPGRPSAFV